MCDYVKTLIHAYHVALLRGIYELIPELIDAGFEILNPVQINAINMEPTKLKNEFEKILHSGEEGRIHKSS